MKILIILFMAFFIPLAILAQNKVDENNAEQIVLTEWMNKISSDSEMRNQMVEMMINQTKGDKEEMGKLINSFTGDPEMNRMIRDSVRESAKTEFSLKPRKMMGDTIKVMEMKSVKPVPKKTD